VGCSLIDEYVKKPSAHGMSTFNGSSVKEKFNSLIIKNMELKFEPCVLNLIWKPCVKDQRKREDHVVFINFGVKKFTIRNTQEIEDFDV
jgi:hypothetical protein